MSDALAKEGLSVCTPIDLSRSEHFDVTETKLVDWVFQMIFEKSFRAVIVEPVCTTFSPAQHPASRSYQIPLGSDRKNPKILLGNCIVFRCLAILWFSFLHGDAGLLEQPLLSKMAWLSIWRFLRSIGLLEAHIDSCMFGSPHRKPFRLLGHGLDFEALTVRCKGGHNHIRVEVKFTKASAVYHPNLAAFIAKKIPEGLRKKEPGESKEGPKLESGFLNDLLMMKGWKVESEWFWEKPAHINVLESRAYVGLTRALLLKGGNRRYSTSRF